MNGKKNVVFCGVKYCIELFPTSIFIAGDFSFSINFYLRKGAERKSM